MEVAIRSIGNSKGVVLPKPLLAQAGLDDQAIAEISVGGGAIILRKPTKPVRVGWAQAAQALAARGGEELLMGEFGNADDAELNW